MYEACGVGIRIKNTFVEKVPQLSPSLNAFYTERMVRSSPASPTRCLSGDLPACADEQQASSPYSIQTPTTEGLSQLLQAGSTCSQDSDEQPCWSTRSIGSRTPDSMDLQPAVSAWPAASSPVLCPLILGSVPWCTWSQQAGFVNGVLLPLPTPPGPVLGTAELPSVGSAGHDGRSCKPCAFVGTKGCDSGASCPFCHLCEPGEGKRRRREKLQHRRQAKAARRRHTQGPEPGQGVGILAGEGPQVSAWGVTDQS